MALEKEIWIADIKEGFIPKTNFLSAVTSMDDLVDNDKINIAESGVDPAVLINNSTFPVAFAGRTDTNNDLVLDTYDTEGTVIRNAEQKELAYDKRISVTRRHKIALLSKFAAKAAHAYAPAEDGANTPIIASSGAALGNFLKITFEDILSLKDKFDQLEIPDDDRVLLLNPTHFNQLTMQDLNLMKAIMQSGQPLFGFKLFSSSKTPVYDKTTGVKAVFGAAAAPTTDTIASVAFAGSEMMKAQGTYDMFERLRDPEQKGDIINFQMRAIALPIRNKFMGAIYSAAKP